MNRSFGQADRRHRPVVDQAVKSRYLERVSTPPEPRVMGGCSRGYPLSVDRGRYRLGIELRNQRREFRPCCLMGKAIWTAASCEWLAGSPESEARCMY